jgi:hypothetical protein
MLSKPSSKSAKGKFTPEVTIGVMLFNEKYAKPLNSIEYVVEDEARVKAMFKFLGISDKNTFYLKDGTYDEVDMLCTGVKLKY